MSNTITHYGVLQDCTKDSPVSVRIDGWRQKFGDNREQLKKALLKELHESHGEKWHIQEGDDLLNGGSKFDLDYYFQKYDLALKANFRIQRSYAISVSSIDEKDII